MEQSYVGKLIEEAVEGGSGKLKAVEVDGGDSHGGGIVWRAFTVEARVVAYVRAHPRFGYV